MKRLYLQTFLAALLLTVSTNANAAVASMADLFGKYKFTATVEVTADGEAYKEHCAAESEVSSPRMPPTPRMLILLVLPAQKVMRLCK